MLHIRLLCANKNIVLNLRWTSYKRALLQLTLYSVFDTRTALYMVQEFAVKGNIAGNIPPTGMPEALCRRLISGVISGVQFIHKQNIVHR